MSDSVRVRNTVTPIEREQIRQSVEKVIGRKMNIPSGENLLGVYDMNVDVFISVEGLPLTLKQQEEIESKSKAVTGKIFRYYMI